MNILAIIIFFGIAQGFFMGIIMITINRGNKKANRVWGVLLILFSLSVLPIMIISSGYYELFPHLFMTGHPLILLFGPLMMLHALYLTSKEYKAKAADVLHFIPFIAYVIILIPIFCLSGDEKIAIISSIESESRTAELIVSLIIVTHVYIYLFFINRIINEYNTRIKDSFSSLNKINLTWLRHSIYSMTAIFAIMLLLTILAAISETAMRNSFFHLLIPLLVSMVLIYDTYKTIHQPEIFIGIDDSESSKRYEKSSLTEIKAISYQEKIIQYMEKEKPFKDSNLTIKNLASKVKIPSYYISQIINEKLSQNFFDFINRYRIEETKTMFQDPKYDSYSILAIAYEAGFNSKSVFNSSFKKYTKMTPSEYRKKLTLDNDEISRVS